MARTKLFLLVDVAGGSDSLNAQQYLHLAAEVLAAFHRSPAALTWGYKLVNSSVAPRVFEAALHDACTASRRGM